MHTKKIIRRAVLLPFLSLLFLTGNGLFGQNGTIVSDPSPLEICQMGNFQLTYAKPGNCDEETLWEYRMDESSDWVVVPLAGSFSTSSNGNILTGENIPFVINNFQFRARAGDCDSSNVLVLIVMSNMGPELEEIQISPANGSICGIGMEDYTLFISPPAGMGVITWFDSEDMEIGAGNNVEVGMPGTYYAVWTSNDGCQISQSEVIAVSFSEGTPIGITATPSGSICPGAPVVLTVNQSDVGIINWFRNDEPTSFLTAPSVTVTVDETTSYRAERTNQTGCMSASLEITITVLSSPPPLTSISSNNTNPCLGDSITLTATGGSNALGTVVRWYDQPGGQGEVLATGNDFTTPANNQTYYARREDDACDNFEIEEQSIIINALPPPFALIGIFTESGCVDTPLEFSAAEQTTGTATYNWLFPGGTPPTESGIGPHAVTYTEQGETEITLTVSNGACEREDVLFFEVVDKPDILVNGELLNEFSETVVVEQFNSMIQFSSSFPDVEFSWEAELLEGQLVESPASGSGNLFDQRFVLEDNSEEALVRLTITASSGICSDTRELTILINRLMRVPNLITINGDGFNECWNIELFGEIFSGEDFDVKLYDRGGNCVMGCDNNFSLTTAMQWCGEGCPAGAFWYTIEGPQGFQKTGSVTLIK